MTKKHFVAIAKRLHDDIECAKARFSPEEQKRTIDAARYAAHLFADVAQQDSPRFDRQRFLIAALGEAL